MRLNMAQYSPAEWNNDLQRGGGPEWLLRFNHEVKLPSSPPQLRINL
jgi:hypothetical protein